MWGRVLTLNFLGRSDVAERRCGSLQRNFLRASKKCCAGVQSYIYKEYI